MLLNPRLAVAVALLSRPVAAASLLGFDLDHALVEPKEILRGGPDKDGIPALTDPKMVDADEAGYLGAGDIIIGVALGGEARAYPLRILIWHENANDVVGGVPVAVTYCPLCNSALVFDRRVGGRVHEFGISGLLWSSNVLLYDRRTESLWSQALMRAVTGPAARRGLELTLLPSEMTTWADWRARHANTRVMSLDTGHPRNYGGNPYASYFTNDALVFPAANGVHEARRYRNKEPMVLVSVDGALKAYAVRDVRAASGEDGTLLDTVGDTRLRLTYLADANSIRVEPVEGPAAGFGLAYLYWFALNLLEVELYSSD